MIFSADELTYISTLFIVHTNFYKCHGDISCVFGGIAAFPPYKVEQFLSNGLPIACFAIFSKLHFY